MMTFGELKGTFYYLMYESKRSTLIFWSILYFFLVTSMLLSLYIDANIYFEIVPAISIYSCIMSFFLVRKNMPYCINLGSTIVGFLNNINLSLVYCRKAI